MSFGWLACIHTNSHIPTHTHAHYSALEQQNKVKIKQHFEPIEQPEFRRLHQKHIQIDKRWKKKENWIKDVSKMTSEGEHKLNLN